MYLSIIYFCEMDENKSILREDRTKSLSICVVMFLLARFSQNLQACKHSIKNLLGTAFIFLKMASELFGADVHFSKNGK